MFFIEPILSLYCICPGASPSLGVSPGPGADSGPGDGCLLLDVSSGRLKSRFVLACGVLGDSFVNPRLLPTVAANAGTEPRSNPAKAESKDGFCFR